MAEPFYKVVVDGAPAPLMRLVRMSAYELKVGSKISVPGFERPQFHFRDIIASIDDFDKLDDARKQAAIKELGGLRADGQKGKSSGSKLTPNQAVSGGSSSARSRAPDTDRAFGRLPGRVFSHRRLNGMAYGCSVNDSRRCRARNRRHVTRTRAAT